MLLGFIFGFIIGALGTLVFGNKIKSLLPVLLLLAANGCSEPDKVNFNTLEDARKQVRAQVQAIAQKWRADNHLERFELMVRGDSTQSPECPQGDGWASVDLVDPKQNFAVVSKLKCSTISLGLGCLEAEDFKSKRFASEENKCNPALPFPLPKLSE